MTRVMWMNECDWMVMALVSDTSFVNKVRLCQ
jgi:hypothetical protein